LAIFGAEVSVFENSATSADHRRADAFADKFAGKTTRQFFNLTSLGGQIADNLRHD